MSEGGWVGGGGGWVALGRSVGRTGWYQRQADVEGPRSRVPQRESAADHGLCQLKVRVKVCTGAVGTQGE